MTKDDIIRMAREAGFEHIAEADYWHPLFERFAALVYTQGHKDGLDDFEAGVLPAAIKAEREACALAAEAVVPRHTECGNKIAAAIRARGQE